MKKFSIKHFIQTGVVIIGCLLVFASCNKPIAGAEPIDFSTTGNTLGDVINTDPNFTFYKALVARAGATFLPLLSDRNNRFTAFIPNDAAFIASGFPTTAAVTSLPVASAVGILNYSIIPGEVLASTDIATVFPNVTYPSSLVIGTLPGTTVPFEASIFPSRRTTGFWVNNIPAGTLDQKVANGVIHVVQRIVSPPSATIKTMINADVNDSLFVALIARGDSGQVPGLGRFDSVLNYALANLTAFIPTNAGMTTTYGITTKAQINGLPVLTARGIVAYHLLGTRVFSVNFPTTATTYATLLGAAPTLTVQPTIVGGFGAALAVTGAANGGSASNSTAPANLDKIAVNGVVHVIDRALKPF